MYFYAFTLFILITIIHDKLAIASEAFGTDVEVLGARIVVERDGGAAKIVCGYIGVPMKCTAIVSAVGKGTLGVIRAVEAMYSAITINVGMASSIVEHIGCTSWTSFGCVTLHYQISIAKVVSFSISF